MADRSNNATFGSKEYKSQDYESIVLLYNSEVRLDTVSSGILEELSNDYVLITLKYV